MTLSENRLDYYYEQALDVSSKSPDSETKVGALLINPTTGEVLSSGYNGFIRGANDSQLPTVRPQKYDYIIHAELNLVLNCASSGISTKGYVVVCTLSPCIGCMRTLYQAGIKTIYFKDTYRDFIKNLGMRDLIITLTNVGKYTKIELRGSKK
jgi:dCMP deaminase